MKMKHWGVMSFLGLLLAMVMMWPALPATKVEAGDKVDVLIAFDRQPGPAEEALVRRAGGTITFTYELVPAIAASIPAGAVAALQRNPRVVRVEPDIEVSAVGEVLPWGVDRIDAEVVHAAGNKGNGVKVAILDSGIAAHPDLAPAGAVNFAKGKGAVDRCGHGTHVAGTVAALDNDIGVIGVAPGVSLYAVKVLGNSCSGSYSSIIKGLEWAVKNGMRVANHSYGSAGDPGATVKAAFDNAYAKGLLSIAAAGNESGGAVIYPAKYASVVAVSATASNDTLASFSSVGPEVELAAPGKDVLSTYLSGGYATLSGTSMASPHGTGVAALLIASGSVTDTNGVNGIADEVRARLQQTATDLGPAGKDNSFGYGLVDAEKAVLGTTTGDN